MKLPQLLLSATSNLSLRAPALSRPFLRVGLNCVGLKLTAQLLNFATDFEIAYKTDQWDNVARHFNADSTYEVRNTTFECTLNGRDAIVAGFRRSLDGFDRHLKRTMRVVDGPHENGNELSFTWLGSYFESGIPPLELSARQTLEFQDSRIIKLVDEYLSGYGEIAKNWIASHKPELNPSYL